MLLQAGQRVHAPVGAVKLYERHEPAGARRGSRVVKPLLEASFCGFAVRRTGDDEHA